MKQLTQEKVIEEIKKGKSLSNFPTYKDNKSVVLESVKKTGLSLGYASERLRDEKEVVLEAVKQNGWALQYASKNLKDDEEVVLEAVKNYGFYLEYASDRLKNDKEVVLKAIKQNKSYLVYATQEIKDRIGNNNPIQCLEQWIKTEKQQEYLNQQLDKKENRDKIKI